MASIKKDLVSGVFYTALAKYSSYVVQLVVTAILARLLTPEDYGVVAVAMVFIVFVNILSDIGIGPAIIQFKNLTREDLSNIFSFTVWIAIVMSTVFFLLSWLIAGYYHDNRLVPVCQLLSITIFFHCLNIVPQNIQYRDKKFRFSALVTLLSYIITAIVAILLAVHGFGVYSLVFQQITSSIIIFSLFYSQVKLPIVLKVKSESLKKILSFSLYQFLFNIINYFARNLDKLLIGRYIGLGPLGQYEKSYRMMLLPLQNITFAVTPVMQPVFSNMHDDLHEMAEKYKKVFTLFCYIGFPLSILLFFVGKELILLFFGDQWIEAILPFRILALSVGLQILNGTAGSIYQSANATKQLFISGCWCGFFMVSSFAISIAGWGTIVAVSIGYVIAQFFNSAQTYYLLFKTLKFPLINILPVMIYPLFITFVIGVILFLTYNVLDSTNLISSLFVKSLIAGTIWSILVNIAGPYKGFARSASKELREKIMLYIHR